MNLNSHLNDFIFCSVIIPTIGRETLDRAVLSVLDQTIDASSFEVIIVNDSGSALSPREWHASSQVRILNTNRRERSFARNSGAAMAKGDYLVFLDDDDWLLPGAFDNLWKLARTYPQAVWLYGGIRIVDEAGNCLAELNSGLGGNCFAQIMGGAWAPIQASMMQANTFFSLGGFNPAIRVTEDEDLCRRFAYAGDFANTPLTIACLFRGLEWTTSSNYQHAPDATKYSRDLILDEPGAFSRMLKSSPGSYWFGRICRVYVSTVGWNLQHKRLSSALSRFLYCLAAFIRSGVRVLTPDFWKGFRAHHAPGALHFVMQDYEDGKMPNTSTIWKEREM